MVVREADKARQDKAGGEIEVGIESGVLSQVGRGWDVAKGVVWAGEAWGSSLGRKQGSLAAGNIMGGVEAESTARDLVAGKVTWNGGEEGRKEGRKVVVGD